MAVVSDHLDTRLRVLVVDDDDAQELIDLLNGSSTLVALLALVGALPSNIFRVDVTATPDQAAARVYPDVDTAIAAAEASTITSPVIWLTEGQAHAAWTGAGFTGAKSMAFMCAADRGATLPVALAAPLPAPGVGAGVLRFARLNLTVTGTQNCAGYTVILHGCGAIGGGGAPGAVISTDHTIEDSDITNIDWTVTGGLNVHRNSTFRRTFTIPGDMFTSVGAPIWNSNGCQYNQNYTVAGANSSLFEVSGGGPAPSLTMRGATVTFAGIAGTTLRAFNNAYTLDVAGSSFVRTSAGTVNYGAIGTTAQISWYGVDPDDGNLPTGSWHNVAGAISQV